MPSLQLSRFTRPEGLLSVRGAVLRRFLEPYRAYFAGHAFDLARLEHEVERDALVNLCRMLLNPRADIPHALVDALFCVHEVALPQNADLLEMAAARVQVVADPQSTLLELTMAIWLADAEVLRSIHQQQVTARVRSFEFFSADDGPHLSLELNDERVRQLERSLAIYFEKKQRGFGCRIHYYPQDHEHWFLVSHGERYRRESTWEDGQSGSIAYRPEKYDLVVYDAHTEELRINAATDSLRDHYRRQFGFYLFGRENHFPGTSKYSLEPLLRDGERALVTDDVPGLERVKLSELCYAIEDHAKEVRIHKAPDVFAALALHQVAMPEKIRLLKASFQLKFAGQARPRSLTLKPSNIALYTRDGDGHLVEEWLMRRGFIQPSRVQGHEQLEHVLEVG